MKYKLLTEKGTHFVCLEDGTKIPLQATTKIEQNVKDPAIATVTAFGFSTQKDRLWTDGKRLMLGSQELTGLISLSISIDPEEITKKCYKVDFQFSCYVELVDTVEQPKPIK